MSHAAMASTPKYCCVPIDLRTYCLVLAILQILYGGSILLPADLAIDHEMSFDSYTIYSIATIAFASVGLYGIIKKKHKPVQSLKYFFLFETIILGLSLATSGIHLIISGDTRCAPSSTEGNCQLGTRAPIIIFILSLGLWIFKVSLDLPSNPQLYSYNVLNIYTGELKKASIASVYAVPDLPVYEPAPPSYIQDVPLQPKPTNLVNSQT
ncbi:hypothetical protein DSO57_1031447 [Entomophthora muscae]|uniref:Uncharacterized protein n=1 Tax=Entomophthora muscae TaxID=34485 RepID=A0ACC2UL20_9FUNG|nr:hypothetical protein DSO57_1031447 [Entomophthora muscae]